jgi:hypothetical protein
MISSPKYICNMSNIMQSLPTPPGTTPPSGTINSTGPTGSGGGSTTPNPFNTSNPVLEITPSSTPSGGGSSPPPSSIPASISSSTASLVYPPELATGGLRIAFSFYLYQKQSLFSPTSFTPTGNTVFLPIPDGIVDNYNVGYQQYDPTYLAELIAQGQKEVAHPTTSGGISPYVGPDGKTTYPSGSAGSSKIGDMVKGYYDNWTAEQTTYRIARTAAKLGGLFDSGVAENIVDNIFGTAINPNTTVALKALALRQHSFSWLIAPKSPSDSTKILQIINEFKTHMLPDTDGTGLLLSYPDIVYPEFIGTTYLYTFKPCVITGFAAVPVGAGQPSFFNGTKAPTLIQITIQLLETELFLRKSVGYDQTSLANQDIGDLSTAEQISASSVDDDSNVLAGPNPNE